MARMCKVVACFSFPHTDVLILEQTSPVFPLSLNGTLYSACLSIVQGSVLAYVTSC